MVKIKGKNCTDHNTIILDLNIRNIDRIYPVKQTTWNLKASNEKWTSYAEEIVRSNEHIEQIIGTEQIPIDQRYKKWLGQIEKAAWSTIGKTTIKQGGKESFSDKIKNMRKTKKRTKTDNTVGKKSHSTCRAY